MDKQKVVQYGKLTFELKIYRLNNNAVLMAKTEGGILESMHDLYSGFRYGLDNSDHSFIELLAMFVTVIETLKERDEKLAHALRSAVISGIKEKNKNEKRD